MRELVLLLPFAANQVQVSCQALQEDSLRNLPSIAERMYNRTLCLLSLEDFWQADFPIGTKWDNMDKLKEINWNFSNLEKAFEEGGYLYGKTVYMFGSTEAQLLEVNGEQKVTFIPVVVVVVSPIPPSDKIGVKSVQRETEEIISMKSMKMAWIPYIPLEKRQSQVERLKTQIYTIGCTQRRPAWTSGILWVGNILKAWTSGS